MSTLNPISIATIGYVCDSVINPIARGTHGYVCLGIPPIAVIGGGHGGVIVERQPQTERIETGDEQLAALAALAIDAYYE